LLGRRPSTEKTKAGKGFARENQERGVTCGHHEREGFLMGKGGEAAFEGPYLLLA